MCPTTNAYGYAMCCPTMRTTTNAYVSTIMRTSMLYATTTPSTNANVSTFMRTSLL